MKKIKLPFLILLTALIVNSCSRNPVSGKREVSLVSTEQEVQMGKEADPQIISYFGLYEDPELQRFIEQKGQQMAKISHRSDITYHFRILDSPVINAFAVPGGYVYFTRGILTHFNNEAQFVGVLGHEIGHIAARHSVQQQTKATFAQLGLIIGSVVSPTFAQFANVAGSGLQLLFLKYGRDDERESDKLGVEYATKIGYDAAEMADFFLTLHRKQDGNGTDAIPGFLSTHPDPTDRYTTVHEMAAAWKKDLQLTKAIINRTEYMQMIDGMIYGEDPRQGFVESNVFYHPELKFQFPIPAQWQYQNTPQMVQMAPSDGNALMMLTIAEGNTLEAAAQNILKNYGLTLVESRNVSVNGIPAVAMIADQPAQQQDSHSLRTLIYLYQYGNLIYSIIGVTVPENFNNYQNTFTNVMQAFQPLSDADKLNRKPLRINIQKAPVSATLVELFRRWNVPETKMKELAILNGLELNDLVDNGTALKILQ